MTDYFAPTSREDSDIFGRFVLHGYEFIQTWGSFVYHLTSRGSRFNPAGGGEVGKDSPECSGLTTKMLETTSESGVVWSVIVVLYTHKLNQNMT